MLINYGTATGTRTRIIGCGTDNANKGCCIRSICISGFGGTEPIHFSADSAYSQGFAILPRQRPHNRTVDSTLFGSDEVGVGM